jgi:translation initiation factor 4A
MVIDEADEMLSRGFKDQIYNIFQFMTEKIQVAIFSATLPPDIMSLTTKFMRDPISITMEVEKLNLECIKQYYIAMRNDSDKYETLKDLFANISVSQCIIYCNSVRRVSELHRAMTEEGFSVCCVHSSMDKADRDREFHNFKTGGYRVLIFVECNCARNQISNRLVLLLISILQKCPHTYLHRIGRSGRWGRKGMAINFVTKQDIFIMKKIERLLWNYNGRITGKFRSE